MGLGDAKGIPLTDKVVVRLFDHAVSEDLRTDDRNTAASFPQLNFGCQDWLDAVPEKADRVHFAAESVVGQADDLAAVEH